MTNFPVKRMSNCDEEWMLVVLVSGVEADAYRSINENDEVHCIS